MEVRYYEHLPLSLFKWRTTMYKNYRAGLGHPYLGDVQTGVMSVEHFLALKESIRKDGCVNPLIVEFDDDGWSVRTGNNRAEAMEQLGETHTSAILIARPSAPWPGGGKLVERYELGFFMRKIWKGVETDGRTYGPKAWQDCNALVELLAR